MSSSSFIFQQWENRIPYYVLQNMEEEKICALEATWAATHSKEIRFAMASTFGGGWRNVLKEARKQSLKYDGRKALGAITTVVCGDFGSVGIVLITKSIKVVKYAKICHSVCYLLRYFLSILKIETVNGKTIIPVLRFAFGSETSLKTKIPHYQIYLEFQYLVRVKKVYQILDELLTSRVHIVVQKVYNSNYMDYCLKPTSNFQFSSNYYWNVKLVREQFFKNKSPKLINMRPKLKTIKNNYLTGQKLLLKIVTSIPDDRTGIWLSDIMGGTGKTALFHSATVKGKNSSHMFIEASSFPKSTTRVYPYEEGILF